MGPASPRLDTELLTRPPLLLLSPPTSSPPTYTSVAWTDNMWSH